MRGWLNNIVGWDYNHNIIDIQIIKLSIISFGFNDNEWWINGVEVSRNIYLKIDFDHYYYFHAEKK